MLQDQQAFLQGQVQLLEAQQETLRARLVGQAAAAECCQVLMEHLAQHAAGPGSGGGWSAAGPQPLEAAAVQQAVESMPAEHAVRVHASTQQLRQLLSRCVRAAACRRCAGVGTPL